MMTDWLDRRSYPFESHFHDVPAGRMHYIDEGTGAPIVMVHGNPTWSYLYRHLIGDFRDRFRCVAPDHIGFGLSDKPAGWSYHPEDHVAHLTSLLDHLELEAITLVVQDWGGPIGLRFAVENPQRVRRLVVMNSWMWPVRDEPYYRAYGAIVGGRLGRFLTRRFNLFARVVMKRVYADPSRLTPDIHRHYLGPLQRPEDRTGCALFPTLLVSADDWLDELWQQRTAVASHPMLIVWGMEDVGFRPKELARWRRSFPSAQVVELEGVGHYVQEEAPDRLCEEMKLFFEGT